MEELPLLPEDEELLEEEVPTRQWLQQVHSFRGEDAEWLKLLRWEEEEGL